MYRGRALWEMGMLEQERGKRCGVSGLCQSSSLRRWNSVVGEFRMRGKLMASLESTDRREYLAINRLFSPGRPATPAASACCTPNLVFPLVREMPLRRTRSVAVRVTFDAIRTRNKRRDEREEKNSSDAVAIPSVCIRRLIGLTGHFLTSFPMRRVYPFSYLTSSPIGLRWRWPFCYFWQFAVWMKAQGLSEFENYKKSRNY